MSIRVGLMLASASLAIGLASGWLANGWRLSAELERARHAQTTAQLAGATQTVARLGEFQKGLDHALEQFQQTQQANTIAAAGLDLTLRDLRGVTAGMRGDFAGLPDRIAAAAEPALREYASTCTAVFTELAERGGRLSERGAEIARQADGHAADVRLLQQAGKVGSAK